MVVFKVSRSRARYGRYGKKRKFGRKKPTFERKYIRSSQIDIID